jgi:hypothetical protein
LENDFQVDVESISDEQILHSAVGTCWWNVASHGGNLARLASFFVASRTLNLLRLE